MRQHTVFDPLSWVDYINDETPDGGTVLNRYDYTFKSNTPFVQSVGILLDAGAKPFGGMAQPQPFQSAVRIGDTNMLVVFLSRMTNVEFTPENQRQIFEWTQEGENSQAAYQVLSNYFIQHTH